MSQQIDYFALAKQHAEAYRDQVLKTRALINDLQRELPPSSGLKHVWSRTWAGNRDNFNKERV